ncbi:MAG: ABC transporter substrate-binding protein [Desulfomonile tiedjei]|nr:ABC transporter substrate-binding protein [Desulfomonile tiedjei]
MKALTRIGVCLVFVTMLLSLTCVCAATWASEPFKIGHCVSLSGVYAALGGDLRDGLNLYMEQVGHKAGGRDIEVLVKNIGSNQVSLALDTAHELIDKHKIDVLSGVVDSGCAYAVAKLTAERQIPFVISNAGADDLTQRRASPFIIRVSFGSSAGSHPLGEWAYNQGFRNAAAVGADNAAGYEQVGGMCRTFTKLGGKIVQEIWTRLGTQDFQPFLAQINRDAEVLLVFLAGGDAQRFVKQYAESGLKQKIAVVSKGFLVDENILSKQGPAAEGIVSESHWCFLLDTPENTQFKAAYAKKYGHPPTLYSEQGYVTGMAIVEALKKTEGQLSGRDLVQAMRSLELKAPRGIIRFDEYGAPVQNYYIRRVGITDGRWQNVIEKTYPSLSQFWTWSPEEFMAMPSYADMKGKWASK